MTAAPWQLTLGERGGVEVFNLSTHGVFLPEIVIPNGELCTVGLRNAAGDSFVRRAESVWVGGDGSPFTDQNGSALRFLRDGHTPSALEEASADRFRLLKQFEVPLARLVPLLLFERGRMHGIATAIGEQVQSETLLQLLAEFQGLGATNRTVYFWRWLRYCVGIVTFPSVDAALREQLVEAKMCLWVANVLVDDLADELRDGVRLSIGIELLRAQLRGEAATTSDPYLALAARAWAMFLERIRRYPRFAELWPVLRFDLEQMLSSMHFAWLCSENPELRNQSEHDAYVPHGCQIVVHGTLDAMCSIDLDRLDLATLRRIERASQRMICLGNMVTTWQRELRSRDYSGGIFAYAIEHKLLSPSDLVELDADEVERRLRIAGAERYFLFDWEWHHHYLERQAKTVRSFDLQPYLGSIEDVLLSQLMSRGLY